MRRPVAIVALVALISLHGAPAAWAGGMAGALTGKTTGPALSFSVVTVVDDTNTSTQGVTALRVQKSNNFDGALFMSPYVKGFVYGCIKGPSGYSLETSTENRFVGPLSVWVPTDVLNQLFMKFGIPDNAVITDITDPYCSTVNGVSSLSFTGTIQFLAP
jgi:hypothetical protein